MEWNSRNAPSQCSFISGYFPVVCVRSSNIKLFVCLAYEQLVLECRVFPGPHLLSPRLTLERQIRSIWFAFHATYGGSIPRITSRHSRVINWSHDKKVIQVCCAKIWVPVSSSTHLKWYRTWSFALHSSIASIVESWYIRSWIPYRVYLNSLEPSMIRLPSSASLLCFFSTKDVAIARRIVTTDGTRTEIIPGT